MNKVWSGRVVKHSPETVSFGTEENVALLERYYPPLVAIADEEDEGKTVRDVLVRHFQVSSKLLAQARTTDYGLTINEERVYISAPVVKGEVVRLRMERETSEFIEPEPMALSIIFEDESLLVINKPPHVIVHPTHGHYSGTLANGVVHYWQQKNEHYRFRPIHRLDEETSGIVVIAKNAYIHQQLSEFMQEGDMDKRYLAIVHGHVQKESFDIEAPIERHPDTPHLRTVRHDGQYAKTGVRCLEQLNLPCGERIIPLSFIELKLYTGRTHQIRVHMHAQGHPLIGDKFYYEEHLQDEALFIGMERQALHAYQLSLTHPLTKERLTFTASLPTDMQTIINRTKSSGGV